MAVLGWVSARRFGCRSERDTGGTTAHYGAFSAFRCILHASDRPPGRRSHDNRFSMPATAPALRGVHPRKAFPPPVPRPSLALWPDLAALENDDLAWALFFVCRRVQDVATAPRGSLKPWKRADDVRNAATSAPEIASVLRRLADELEPAIPESRSTIARACHEISSWAADLARGELAIQLSEAAMAIQPRSARRTFEAARMNRYFGNAGRAETHYLRAICLARASKRWWVYVRGHLGLGLIQKGWGNHDRALAHSSTAARAAWKLSGEKWLAARTEHALMAHHLEADDLDSAFDHAQRAYELMPKHNEKVPALAHDYAYYLVRVGAYHLALPLLEMVSRREMLPAHKVIVWSTLARAAACLGRVREFREGEGHVEELAPSFDLHAAAAFANLATGAFFLGLSSEAEAHAIKSIEIASTRAQVEALAVAQPLLNAIRRGEQPASRTLLDPAEAVVELAQNLATLLSGWRGPTWKRKQHSGSARLGRI